MGNSERSNDPPADVAIDGWFDLLDDEPTAAVQRPTPRSVRPANAPNLSALNEISNKVTPVVLAPVHHLLPAIEPSQPPLEARDVWETDIGEGADSFFSVQPANNAPEGERLSNPDPLPPLMEMSDADGEEFLDFGDGASPHSPVGGNLFSLSPRAHPTPSDFGAKVTPVAVRGVDDLAEGPEVEFEPNALPPPLASSNPRASFTRPSRPPNARLPNPADIPVSTPLPATLLNPRTMPPPGRPANSPQPADEDEAFDLSDFDRWGRDDEVTPSAGTPATLLQGSEFTSQSPPTSDFSDALTMPRRPSSRTMNWSDSEGPTSDAPTNPGVPSSAPAPTSWESPPPVPSAPPAPFTQHKTPVWPSSVHEMPTPVLPPPLPNAQAVATPAPPRRPSPEREMHERFDLGDFAGALSIAEQMIEVDPDNGDPAHIAEVCRAKLRAIYIGRLGSLDQVPVIAVTPAEFRLLALDHRAGFILSLVDGMSSLEDIVDISGMPHIEALRTLYNLSTQQVISLRKR